MSERHHSAIFPILRLAREMSYCAGGFGRTLDRGPGVAVAARNRLWHVSKLLRTRPSHFRGDHSWLRWPITSHSFDAFCWGCGARRITCFSKAISSSEVELGQTSRWRRGHNGL